ncbi:MAG: hypothetical protein ACLP8A_05775 [Methylovirgula sp.]
MNFVKALEDEIAALESALETDPRFLKLRELRRLQQIYTSDTTRVLPKMSPFVPALPSSSTPGRKTSPARRQAIEKAVEFLDLQGGPAKTTEILDYLKAVGVEIGGADPRNNLSALLYHSDMFESHGRAGWVLKRNETDSAYAPSDNDDESSEREGPFTRVS